MNLQKILRNDEKLFWLLQIGGWGGWGLQFYVSTIFWGISDRYHWYLPLVSSIGLLLTLVLRQIYKRTWEKSIWYRIVLAGISTYVAAVLWMSSRNYFYFTYLEPGKRDEIVGWWTELYFLKEVSGAYFIMVCWTALYFGIKYARLLQREREQGLKVQSMAHEAQLKMLRYQLNPHFLFNTLNAVSTLILEKDNDLANKMITRLSSFLRYSLDNDPMQKVSLIQELEALKLYLDIEKVRFGERLQLVFDIEEDAETGLIPSMLLQPLVENSIKYAIAKRADGGTIRVAARVFAGDLLLELSDNGPGLEGEVDPAAKGTGVGLKNTRDRLVELYGDNQSFRLSKTEPTGLTANIRIPFETDEIN